MKNIQKNIVGLIVLSLIALTLWGCGSGSGGSTSYLNTVTLSPSGTTSDTTSTVSVSGNTSDPAVSVSIVSTPNPKAVTPSPVTIHTTTISYRKTSNSPLTAPDTLPTQSGPVGNIPPGATVPFSFVVASGIFKDNLVTNSGFVPGGPKWEYFVTFEFNGTEDYTKNDVSFTAPGGKITFQ